jgi:hypothetical protein
MHSHPITYILGQTSDEINGAPCESDLMRGELISNVEWHMQLIRYMGSHDSGNDRRPTSRRSNYGHLSRLGALEGT